MALSQSCGAQGQYENEGIRALFNTKIHILGWTGHVLPLTRYLLLFGLILLGSCGKPVTVEVTESLEGRSPLQQLRAEIETILSDSLLAPSNVGMKVVSAITGETLYENNAEKLYHPASTMKLITAATALVKLKPNYRFHTTLYADSIEAGRVQGNIYLKGRGDPLFTTHNLEAMVRQLVQLHVKEVPGNIVVDETYFDDIRRGAGWMWDDGPIGGYYSHLSALTINHNGVVVKVSPGAAIGNPVRVQLNPSTQYIEVVNEATTIAPLEKAKLHIERQTGHVAPNAITLRGAMTIGQAEVQRHVDIVDPALYCGTLLKEMLGQNEITVQGLIQHGQVPDNVTEIVDHTSPPLFIVVQEMNKPSDNLSAELLLKTIGSEIKDVPGTSENGLHVINEFLTEIGLDTTQSTLADGSGVSRYNLLSASMLTSLLAYMFQDFAVMPEYLASLPIAGVDGTLSRRMKGTAAEGVLRAKTGTMRGVTTLAGYAMTSDCEILTFAMLMNHYVGSSYPRRALQDKIGNALARFSQRRSNTTIKRTD